ncbi:MAG TPA: PIN domain-containing protein [Candidatus Sulfotelmatobacter sp.]|nr:PIN domain-containing protein [Candidatus Sulfotelmatobacter sp.]
MRQAVLADTGPLYAAADPDDANHPRAVKELQQLARVRREVMVCFPILLESYSLVLFRLGRKVASRWLREMNDAALVNPSPEDYRQAAALLHAFGDQSITLFDATVAVLASRLAVPVWTYDHHFAVMRATVWR